MGEPVCVYCGAPFVYGVTAHNVVDCLERVVGQNERLRTALADALEVVRFYAPPEKYRLKPADYKIGAWADILEDEGARARSVLPEYQGKGEGERDA